MAHILVSVHTSGSHYRDLLPILVSVLLYQGDNALHLFLVLRFMVGFRYLLRVRLELCQLLPGKAQMTACQRSLNHYQIRSRLIVSVPHLADNLGSLDRGHDRCNFSGASLHIFRQIHRKTGPRNNEIRADFHGSLHVLNIILGGNHDIKADDAFRGNSSGLFQFALHGPQICLLGIAVKIRLPKADLCG